MEALYEKEINDTGSYDITELFTSKVSGNITITFNHSDPLSWKEQEAGTFLMDKEMKEIEVVIEDIEKCTERSL